MRYFPTVCPRKNICAHEYTLRVRPRFYVPDLDATAARALLPDDEAEHLVRVLRLGIGAEIEVFNGRGGLELPDNLRAGCAGLIPAPDCFEAQIAIYEAMRRGDEAAAEQRYGEILPAIVFVMQSIDHLLCYGKRLTAARLGLEVFDRDPGLLPTAFGEAAVARFARALGPMKQ